MKHFLSFNLPEPLLKALKSMKYESPTPVQMAAIPPALEGRDVLGLAQTGTGKTAAFAIPIVARMVDNPKDMALVMAPTRELATQVLATFVQLIKGANLKMDSALLIGGDSMPKQLSQLRKRPRIVVGTPGRVYDHLIRKSLNLSQVRYFVLDEMDRMLDMGFSEQIEVIAEFLPKEKQTLLFSATLPKKTQRLTERYLKDPVMVSIESKPANTPQIQQEAIYVKEEEKYAALKDELNKREGSVIVFVKTKVGADDIADRLHADEYEVDAIHGDLRQRQRERTIKAFRDQKYRIMVATDVAARGLDIPHIEHVINYDMPQCLEDYVHRIGRTGRAGAKGASLCFVTPKERNKWQMIQRITKKPVRA